MTLATGNKREQSGFTLIELSIALFIIAIMIAVSIPSFMRSYNASLMDSTGRTVITSCQFAKLNAVLHQQKVEFNIDLDKQTMWLTQTVTNETDDADSSGQVLKTIEIPGQVRLLSAQMRDEPLQQRGQVAATFYPNGTCDAFTITFGGSEKGAGLAIVVDPVTSRAIPWPVKL
jgi:prepilin-type N-terminal cleavage/methylation domain-containing protein